MADMLCDHVAGKLELPLKGILNADGWGAKLIGVMKHAAVPALGAGADGEQAACVDRGFNQPNCAELTEGSVVLLLLLLLLCLPERGGTMEMGMSLNNRSLRQQRSQTL